jgi:hypothetical protein
LKEKVVNVLNIHLQLDGMSKKVLDSSKLFLSNYSWEMSDNITIRVEGDDV